VKRRLFQLIGGTLTFWLFTAFPARWLGGGDHALVYSATAVALCLVPAILTMVWIELAAFGPEQKMTAALGGTGLRMAFVLGGALLLQHSVPYFREQDGFLLWILVIYLVTLTLEIALLVAGQPAK